MKKLFSLLAGSIFLCIGSLLAQPITVTSVTNDLTQCGPPKPFSVTIHNTTSTANAITWIRIKLPSCVRYVPGSISGANFTVPWVNTTGDSLQVNFSPSLAAFATATFTINVRAVCGINCGPVVSNNIHIQHGQGTFHGTSNPYNIQSPSISIQSVTPLTTSATVGSTFQRCVTLVNGGFGAASSLTLSVQSTPTSLNNTLFRLGTNGALLTPTVNGSTQTVAIGPAQIQTIGDLDTLLEQGETITICYDVNVLDCINLSSTITAAWGCNGQNCATQIQTANVTVPAVLPHIVASNTYLENHCYGGTTPSVIKIVLKNDGSGPARDVKVYLWEGVPAAFAPDDLSAFDSINVLLRPSTGGSSVLATDSLYPENGASCPLPNGTERLSVTIPFLPAGQTDTIIVRRYSCCKGVCLAGYMRGVYYNVGYKDQCKTSNYSITPIAITGDNIGRVVSFVHSGASNLNTAWAKYEIEHSDFRFFSADNGGYAIVQFTVPTGLQLDLTQDSIYFDYPTRPLHWLPAPGTTVQIGNIVRARFDFSHPGYSASLEKVMLKFRLRADCGAGPCAGGPKTLGYKIYEKADPNCACEAVIACYDLTVNTHCGFCSATCADGGLMFLSFDATRKNYGPSDNDENGLPDAVSLLDYSSIRIRHLMLRDTLTTKFKGVVNTTTANPLWETGFVKSTITQGALLRPLSYKVRIVDQTTGISHSATSTTYTYLDTLTAPVRRAYTFSLNPGSLSFTPSLPLNFVYGQGDSVEVSAAYVVDNNIGTTIEMQSIVNEFKMQRTNGFKAGCDTYRGDFTLVGYYLSSYGPDVYAAKGCDTITVSESYYLSIGNCCYNYAGGNVFRKEFRHFAIPSQHVVTVPNGYTLVAATMDHTRTEGLFGQEYYAAAPVPFTTSGNVSTLMLRSRFQPYGGPIPRGDDGFYGTVRLKLIPSCRVTPYTTLLVNHRMIFEPVPNLTGPGSVTAYDDDNDHIRYTPPNLVITPALTTMLGVSSTVTWNFTLSNNSNAADAGNVWFALVSPSGQVIPTQVQSNCSTTVTPTSGGLYQVGSLNPGAARNYCITATYGSCNLDSLRIITGWDCNAYPANAPAYTCTPTVRTVYVQPQPTEMQSTITTGSSTVGICDSLLVEVTVASTQIGDLNNIGLVVTLPLTGGLTYAPASAKMLYPTSGTYTTVPGPTILANTLTWSVNAINSTIATNGLPGTLQTNQNVFKLRFYVRTNCSMVSGDRIRLQVNGNRSCGTALTPLILLSSPINIIGANPPYQSNVTTSIADVSSCPMTKRITVTMVNAGPGATVSGDRVVVTLANGYAYGAGFVGISNPPPLTNPTIVNGSGSTSFAWGIPAGLAAGSTISFSFLVNVANTVPCGTDIATVQALNNQVLFCARTASNCASSAVQTGASTLSINVQRPDLNFAAFTASFQPISGGYTMFYNGSLHNAGTPILAGTTVPVNFYCDTDASGGYTAGDVLLGTYNYTSGIGTNGNATLSGNFFVNSTACAPGMAVTAMISPSATLCICNTASRLATVITPVEWQSIHGEALAEANEITWTATILQGHDHFVLEKAVGQGWSDISAPIYGTQGSYTARDAHPSQVERYRVRAVDQDGSTKHSPTVEILRNASEYMAHLYPNPASKTVNLQAPAGSHYRIVNALGQEVANGYLPDNAPLPLDISRYASGIYQVEFQQGRNQAHLRLVVE